MKSMEKLHFDGMCAYHMREQISNEMSRFEMLKISEPQAKVFTRILSQTENSILILLLVYYYY